MNAGAAIVIVSFRTPRLTVGAVTSALAEDGVSEVIVVDNASLDETVANLAALEDARLTVVQSAANEGFGAAANRGARLAQSDALVFLNSDAHIKPGGLRPALRELARNGGRAICGPRVVEPSGRVQRSAGMVPRPLDLVLRATELQRVAAALASLPVLGSILHGSPMGRDYATALSADTAVDTSMISGSCLLIGRAAFLDLGGFDERYFMYFEDADLCRRASAASMPIRYVPAAVVTHVGGASSTGDYHYGPLHGSSMVVYLRRWHGLPGALLGLFLLAGRAAVSSVFGRPDAARFRAALAEGVRAYRDGRSRSPKPRSMPSP